METHSRIEMDIRIQQSQDNEQVELLLDLTFGTHRYNKAAYGLRNNTDAISQLSFVIYDRGQLIASLRFWPIMINTYPALLLGPIAVQPKLQGLGYGLDLMKWGLDAAKALGHKRVILVGEEKYYCKVGFSRQLATKIWIKGQSDESRILACAFEQDAFNFISGEAQNIYDFEEKNVFLQK